MADEKISENPLVPLNGINTDMYVPIVDPTVAAALRNKRILVSTLLTNWVAADIATLRAVTFHADGQMAATLGETAPGDGGNAMYRYDESDSQADNGFSILIPDDVTRPATGSWVQYGT